MLGLFGAEVSSASPRRTMLVIRRVRQRRRAELQRRHGRKPPVCPLALPPGDSRTVRVITPDSSSPT
jgi:hypothetical protein